MITVHPEVATLMFSYKHYPAVVRWVSLTNSEIFLYGNPVKTFHRPYNWISLSNQNKSVHQFDKRNQVTKLNEILYYVNICTSLLVSWLKKKKLERKKQRPEISKWGSVCCFTIQISITLIYIAQWQNKASYNTINTIQYNTKLYSRDKN